MNTYCITFRSSIYIKANSPEEAEFQFGKIDLFSKEAQQHDSEWVETISIDKEASDEPEADKTSGKGDNYNPNTPQGKIFKQLGEINQGKKPTKKDLNALNQAATDFATGYLPDGSSVDSIEEPDTDVDDTRIRILFSYKGYDYDLHFIAYKDGTSLMNLWNFNDHGEHLDCVWVGTYERIADAIERLGHDSPSQPQEVSSQPQEAPTIDSRVEQLESVVSRLDSDMKAIKKQIKELKKHK